MTNPDKTWTLYRWFEEMRVTTDYISDHSARKEGDTISKISASTLKNWANDGIPNRDKAINLIRILNQIARERQLSIFSDKNLQNHAHIFLCSDFVRLSSHEPHQLTRKEVNEFILNAHSVDELRYRVFPPPPDKMFGRDDDINLIQHSLSKSPIVVVESFAGNGKTSLAWLVANRMSNHFLSVDWVTDKRQFIDVHGEEVSGIGQVLTEQVLLKSMIYRFKWEDLYGLNDLSTMMIQCGKKLRENPHLLIVDNIETAYTDKLRNFMLHLVKDSNSPSKILITSRQALPAHSLIHSCPIKGLDQESAKLFVQHLLQNTSTKLADNDMEHLVNICEGNPLFIQIIINRWKLRGGLDKTIQMMQTGNRFWAFQKLFGTMLASIAIDQPEVRHVLKDIAHLIAACPDIQPSEQFVLDTWNMYSSSQQIDRSIFEQAIDYLLMYKIINIKDMRYHMHPLIRAYLRQIPN
jgi:hypothetical protein